MHNLFLFMVMIGMFTLPRFYFDFRKSFCSQERSTSE